MDSLLFDFCPTRFGSLDCSNTVDHGSKSSLRLVSCRCTQRLWPQGDKHARGVRNDHAIGAETKKISDSGSKYFRYSCAPVMSFFFSFRSPSSLHLPDARVGMLRLRPSLIKVGTRRQQLEGHGRIFLGSVRADDDVRVVRILSNKVKGTLVFKRRHGKRLNSRRLPANKNGAWVCTCCVCVNP